MLEKYIKAVLYAYPLLKTVEEDYAEHIRNKALLSYNSRLTTQELAEYLAGEILHKSRLVWLKEVIEQTMARLSETERALLAIRYFGKNRKLYLRGLERKGEDPLLWSERKYFRMQQRLGEKVSSMLKIAGVTKALFDSELAEIDIFRKICKYIEKADALAQRGKCGEGLSLRKACAHSSAS